MSVSGNEHNRNSFLFRKYLDGTCSNDEAQEIVSVLEDSGNDISLIDEANTEWKNINSSNNNNLKYELNTIEIQIIMDRILDRLHHRIRLQEEEISRKYSVMKFLTIFSKIFSNNRTYDGVKKEPKSLLYLIPFLYYIIDLHCAIIIEMFIF